MKKLITIIYTILLGLLQFLKYLFGNLFHTKPPRKDWPGEPVKTGGPYEILPGQLSNKDLLELDRRDRPEKDWIFPKEAIISKGRIINPLQFIVAVEYDSRPHPELDKTWAVGNVLWLGREGSRIQVRVKKSRKCAPEGIKGKRYVLLESVDKEWINQFEGQTIDIINSEGNFVGTLHDPGVPNPSAGQDHSGGQSNCYGAAFLVRSSSGTSELDTSGPKPMGKSEEIIVAVLDSGILDEEYREDAKTTCSDLGQFGWNFVDDNPFPKDDHLGLHGTKVSWIIKRHAPNARIMPVKVSNQNGRIDLYDALCGLEYARTHGAKLVNASWSFTGNKSLTEESDFPLLLGAIRDMDQSWVMMIAAAGNRSQYIPDAEGEIARGDAPMIYPACYTTIQRNVITVTTVVHKPEKFSVFENYSSRYVDTGVLPSVPTSLAALPEGEFVVPGFIGSYEGSSFATPIVAARVAEILYRYGWTPFANKESILQQLSGFHKEDDLVNEIRYGGCYVQE